MTQDHYLQSVEYGKFLFNKHTKNIKHSSRKNINKTCNYYLIEALKTFNINKYNKKSLQNLNTKKNEIISRCMKFVSCSLNNNSQIVDTFIYFLNETYISNYEYYNLHANILNYFININQNPIYLNVHPTLLKNIFQFFIQNNKASLEILLIKHQEFLKDYDINRLAFSYAVILEQINCLSKNIIKDSIKYNLNKIKYEV